MAKYVWHPWHCQCPALLGQNGSTPASSLVHPVPANPVYVDDYIILLRRKDLGTVGMAIVVFLLSIGCPLSWKKTAYGVTNIWLGYQLNSHTAHSTVTHGKMMTILNGVDSIILGEAMTSNRYWNCWAASNGPPQPSP